jgi:hypothetical protein
MHLLDVGGGGLGVDTGGGDVEGGFALASGDGDGGGGVVELGFGDAYDGDGLVEGVVEVCAETWVGGGGQPDVAVDDDEGWRAGECGEGGANAGEFAEVELAWDVGGDVGELEGELVCGGGGLPIVEGDGGGLGGGVGAVVDVYGDDVGGDRRGRAS